MSVREAKAERLVGALTEELKKFEELTPPSWSRFVKTGVSRERPPEQPDWWYMRAASMLRRIYLDGPVGVSRLRTYYGGRQNRGQAPEHSKRGGGKIVRTILQQLEKAGLVKKADRSGRKLTPKGSALLEGVAEKLRGDVGGAGA
ncbi:MAG: 30S ribosomal protein S19e [Candidatus Hadarchaeales archaeon]